MRKATNIMWDYDEGDGIATFLGLPDYVEIPEDVEDDDISDLLSDVYGYCVFGYTIERS